LKISNFKLQNGSYREMKISNCKSQNDGDFQLKFAFFILQFAIFQEEGHA